MVRSVLVVLSFSLSLVTTVHAGKKSLPTLVNITSDGQVPKPVQVIWRNGFEECTEKGINTSQALNGLKITFKGDSIASSPALNGPAANGPAASGLYLLGCGGPGYNRPFVAFSFDGKKQIAQRVAFPVAGKVGIGTQFIIYNFVWNNEKSQISSFGKDRGLGDCGTKATWQWAYPQFDSHFILVAQKTKIDCDGQTENYPNIWPPKSWPPKALKIDEE